jgi:hypothetical protein
MNIRNAIRIPVLAIGLTAALLLAAGPVRAQADAQPETFDVNPTTPPTQESVVAVAASNGVTKGAPMQTAAGPEGIETSQPTQQEATLAGFSIEDGLLTLILTIGTGSIFLYAKVATRREQRLHPSMRRYTSISGATTH